MRALALCVVALLTACHDSDSIATGVWDTCAITPEDAAIIVTVDGEAGRPGTIGSLAAFADGSFAIADRQRPSIWLYTADGKPARQLGRQGRGPAEFENVAAVHTSNGDVVVVDNVLRRVTMLGRDGSYLGAQDISRFGLGVRAAYGPFEVGEWLLISVGETTLPRDRPTMITDTIEIVLVRGEEVAVVAREPGRMRYADLSAGFSVVDVPFTPGFSAGRTEDGIVFGDGRTASLRKYAAANGAVDLLHLPLDGEPVTSAMERAYVEATARGARDPERVASLLERSRPWPDRTPPYGRVISDGASELLVERYAVGDVPRDYVHMNTDGRVLQSFALPVGVRAVALSRRTVFATTEDELGVESVLIFKPRCNDAGAS
jgi:hypothetical protein